MTTSAKKRPKQSTGVWLHSRLPEELYEEIQNAAEAESRNISNMIRVLLEEALKHRKGAKK